MSERLRSQKGFVAVTLITVLAIALVLVVYATILATFTGGEVTVGAMTGNVGYSETNTAGSTWKVNLYGVTGAWYARTNFTSTYIGTVDITWQLEKDTGSWGNVSTPVITSSYTLNGNGSQPCYATTNGLITGNQDWSAKTSGNGDYRIVAYIESA